MSHRYEVLLVDLDLTIFDFRASEQAAFRDCMTMLGVAERTDEVFPRYKQINDALWAGVERGELSPDEAGSRRFVQLLGELDLDGDPTALGAAFQHGLGQHGDLYDGAAEVLDALAEHVPLALVTNGIGAVQRAKISRLDLERWFSAIVISGEVGVAKPDPTIFDLAFDELDNPDRSRALMVGDSLSSDMAGGRAASIATCWYRPVEPTGAPQADPMPDTVDHRIGRLDELLGLARRSPGR